MKKTNKKGFTIVELVIVIAVIGILAAVLIPTFAGIIESANRTADTQLVTNINTILAIEDIVGGGVNDAVEIQNVIKKNGLKLETKVKGQYLWYDIENKKVVLGGLDENGFVPNGARSRSATKGQFNQDTIAPENFIDGYLFLSTESADGLAENIYALRNPNGTDENTIKASLNETLGKIKNTALKNNLSAMLSTTAVMAKNGAIGFIGDNNNSVTRVIVSSEMTNISTNTINTVLAYPNVIAVDFHSAVVSVSSSVDDDAITVLKNRTEKPYFIYSNDELKKVDIDNDNIAFLIHKDERGEYIKKVYVQKVIDGEIAGATDGELITEFLEYEFSYNLAYEYLPGTATESYDFVGYSFHKDGSNPLAEGAHTYKLNSAEKLLIDENGNLTIYLVYNRVATDFMVNGEYYSSKTITRKLDKGEITSGTITVVSTTATLGDETYNEITIPNGVELLVPTESLAKLSKALVSEKFVKVDKETVAGKTKLTINSGVELVVEPNAKIYVDAKLYTYGTYYQCFTKEDCGVLVLEDGSKITSDGTITAYGVIRGDGEILVNDGELIEIMTIYDWYGGSNAAAAVGVEGGLGSLAGAFTDIPLDGKNVVPFNEWGAENIRVTTTVKASALYKAETGILLNNDVFVDFELTSGASSDQPLFLLDPDAYIERSVSDDGDAKITIYGNVSDTSKKMVIEGIVSGMGSATIDFSKIALPLSHFDVNISEGSTFTISKNIYKVLPGSDIVVDGTLNINGNAKVVICNTYDQKFMVEETTVYTKEVTGLGNTTRNKLTLTLAADGKSINIVCQPEKKGWFGSSWSNNGNSTTATIKIPLTYSVTTPAKLVINGELNFAGNALFAGEITSEKSGAKITSENTVSGHTIPTGWYIQSNSTGLWYNTYSDGLNSSTVMAGINGGNAAALAAGTYKFVSYETSEGSVNMWQKQ